MVVAGTLAGAAGAWWVLRTYHRIDRITGVALHQAEAGEPRNYLVVGSDHREDGEGGVLDKRSDSIMLLRLDPDTGEAAALSFPRDLQVRIAGTGETRKINSAYNGEGGVQRLIDTIEENFGLPIHHYVEVDFAGFKALVDHVGGIPMYFEHAVRNPPPGPDGVPDEHDVGLYIPQRGCVTVDGTQALALARSRVLQYRAPDGWRTDVYGDYGRMTRQQIILRQALRKAVHQARTSPTQLAGLVELLADNVTLDASLGLGDLLDLAQRLRDFDPDALRTWSLPTSTLDEEGRGDPWPDLVAAQPILDVFRGPDDDAGEDAVDPGSVRVTVRNGSGVDRQAAEATDALAALGFAVGEPTTAPEPAERTTVHHAPGEAALGLAVARHLGAPAPVLPRDDLAPGEVELLTGADFTGVAGESDDTGAAGDTRTTVSHPSTTPPPATTTPPPESTDPVGYPAGQAPPGKECD